MIDFDFLEIKISNDYQLLHKKLKSILPYANHDNLIQELTNRLGLDVKFVVIEYPYRDFDFSSVYSSFYSKKHLQVSKECIRLHFFSDEDIENKFYIGNIVVRDSAVCSRGRALFDPVYLLQVDTAYTVKNIFKSHIMGKELAIETFPWMSQDTDIAICAHVAVWSINNYYASKYPNYTLKAIAQIAEIAPMYLGRKTPSHGLNLLQISDMFSKLGFFPLVLQKNSQNPKEFFQAVYSYIESGIPMVGAMTKKEHAVAIIGHSKVDNANIQNSIESIINIADHIEDFIISDDNELPFSKISRNNHKYMFEDLDYVIIPLYEKMYINANNVYERVKTIIESNVLNISEQIVVRVYLTSARSLKREALNNKSMNTTLKSIVLKLHIPQFVWCIDICTKDEYQAGLTSSRLIIDSTAGTYEDEPWLLMHDNQKIVWKFNHKIYKKDKNIMAYDMYKNNLKETKR